MTHLHQLFLFIQRTVSLGMVRRRQNALFSSLLVLSVFVLEYLILTVTDWIWSSLKSGIALVTATICAQRFSLSRLLRNTSAFLQRYSLEDVWTMSITVITIITLFYVCIKQVTQCFTERKRKRKDENNPKTQLKNKSHMIHRMKCQAKHVDSKVSK